jgi:phage/plasmid-associated DNA primase
MGNAIIKLNLKDVARLLMGLGFRVVPVDADKKPLVKGWNAPIPEEKVFKASRKASGIAIVGGKINENEGVMTIDVDNPDNGFKILENVFGSDWRLKLCGPGSLCGFTGPRPKGKVKCECTAPGEDCKCRNVETGEEAPLSALKRGMYIVVRPPADCLSPSTVRGGDIEILVNNYEVIYGKHPSGAFYEPVRFIDGKWVRIDITEVGPGVKLTCDEVNRLIEALRPKPSGEANTTTTQAQLKPAGEKRLIRLDNATIVKIAGALIDGYKQGQRQKYALAIAGWFGMLGVDSVSVALLIKELHEKTGDEEPLKERLSTIVYTYIKLGLPVDIEGIKAATGVELPKLGDDYYRALEEKLKQEGVLKITGANTVKELLANARVPREEAEKRIKEVRGIVRAERLRLTHGNAILNVVNKIKARMKMKRMRMTRGLAALMIADGVQRILRNVRYITYSNVEVGGFRCWDGTYFRPCLPDIEATIELIYELSGLYKYYEYTSLKKDTLELLKDETTVDITDAEFRYIAFRNVVYDWVEGRAIPLSEVKPDMLIMNAIPHELNLQALEEATKAPELTEELAMRYAPKTLAAFKEWVGDNWRVLFEVIGAVLYPRPIKRVILLLDEEERANLGDTGKSTFIMLIIRLLGRENYSTVPLQDLADDDKRFAKWPLFLKLANVYSDLPMKAIKDTGLIKVMTGRDTILIERKHHDQFNYRPYAKFIYSANKPPRISSENEADLAFWKRFLIIQFEGRFSRPIEDFELTLMDEASSILALSIAAFRRVKERGFRFTTDPESDLELAVRNRTIWLLHFDEVFKFLVWLLRNHVLVEDPEGRIPTTHAQKSEEGEVVPLYDLYRTYTDRLNLDPVAPAVFTRRVRELGMPMVTVKGVHYIKGFRIDKAVWEDAIGRVGGGSGALPPWFRVALSASSSNNSNTSGDGNGANPESSQGGGQGQEATEAGLGKPPEPKAQEPVNVDELLRLPAEEANNRLKARWPNADYKDIVEGMINYIAGEGEVNVDKLTELYGGTIADRLKEAGYSEAELEDDVYEFIKIVIDVLKEKGVVTDA